MTYDDLGRLSKTEKKVNSTVSSANISRDWSTISVQEYDALGQLKVKKMGSKLDDPNTTLAKLQYEYNIRRWLLSINKDYIINGNNTDQYFGMQLGYDKDGFGPFSNKHFNGNIGGTIWRSAGDGVARKYDFTYDGVNRILSADFNQQNSSMWDKSANIDFSMKMGDGSNATSAYDANGNILAMQHNGLKLNTSPLIDQLTYSYKEGSYSNKLASVADAINVDNKLGDFKNGTNGGDDYAYDVNGNLTIDNNKSIAGISYNYLNLPQNITVTSKGSISYTYDAGGNKLKKTSIDNSIAGKTITTSTTYSAGMVFESKSTSPADADSPDYTDVLQFIGHEEGRIRIKPAVGSALAQAPYDYMIKDHLGNVRVVLTDEVQQDKYPVATLEVLKLGTEKKYYDIHDDQIVDKIEATGITDYPNDNGIGNNPSDPGFEAMISEKLYRLNGNTAKMGLGIALKVMPGDEINVFGNSYYFTNTVGPDDTYNIPILDLLNGFLNSPTNSTVFQGHGQVTASDINTSTGVASILGLMDETDFYSHQSPTKPKSFINVIFFDEQFKADYYSLSMVGENSELKDHHQDLQNLIANKSGYVYVYCSNESEVDVFFDNIQVVHTRGPILEETHYYPFGLTMAGISSKAAGGTQNRNKFNDGTELENDEFSDGSGLELYATEYRSYDPQIGRFHQSDPLTEIAYDWSTYAFANNNPILLNDPLGLSSDTATKPTSDPFIGVPLSQDVTVVAKSKSASEEVINNNWLIRLLSAKEVINADRAIDAYQNGGINNYLYTSISNAHSETMLEFSSGGYINPFNRTLAVANRTNLTRSSVDKKLAEYLLNPNHIDGKTKAKWFETALGFTKANADDLANQVVFDPSKAVQTAITQHGVKYTQHIEITGANGRVIKVPFNWIRNNDNVVRLVGAIPVKKP